MNYNINREKKDGKVVIPSRYLFNVKLFSGQAYDDDALPDLQSDYRTRKILPVRD